MIIAGIGVAGWMDIYPALKIPLELPFLVPTQQMVDWGTFGVGIGVLVVGVIAMLLALRFISDDLGDRGLARTLRFISISGSFTSLWVVVGFWGIVAPSVGWVFQIPAWIAMALTPVLVGYSGSLHLLVRRRKVRGSSYLEMLIKG